MVKLSKALVLGRSRASDLENVRKLNVWGSDLTDVSIIRKLTAVQVVSLSVNKITTLSDFAHCPNLEELYIRKNEISELTEICHLKDLPKLRILWLADNPCAQQENYRMTVLKTLPNLQKLDNVVVEDSELNTAIEQGVELSMTSNHVKAEPERVQEVPNHVVCENGDGAIKGTETVKEVPAEGMQDDEADQPEDTVNETNQIRQQLGLKPLPMDKLTPARPISMHAKARNHNILQAALCLVKELDPESLEVLSDAVRTRLDQL